MPWQVVACTPDSVGGDVLGQYKLPPQILCKLSKVELKVSNSKLEPLSKSLYPVIQSVEILNSQCCNFHYCCLVQADPQTDEVYAQMDLTPQCQVCCCPSYVDLFPSYFLFFFLMY